MAHLMRPEGATADSCDICGKNTKKHKIHDREKCACIHGDAKILEIVNKELKIARGAVGAGGTAAIGAVAGGRLAYTKFGKTPKVSGAKPTAKVGAKTTGALMAAGGVLTIADGIMGIVDAATATIPQERCTECGQTFPSPGCILYCGDCLSKCIDRDWRKGSSDGKCCYNICDDCYGRLVGN